MKTLFNMYWLVRFISHWICQMENASKAMTSISFSLMGHWILPQTFSMHYVFHLYALMYKYIHIMHLYVYDESCTDIILACYYEKQTQDIINQYIIKQNVKWFKAKSVCFLDDIEKCPLSPANMQGKQSFSKAVLAHYLSPQISTSLHPSLSLQHYSHSNI